MRTVAALVAAAALGCGPDGPRHAKDPGPHDHGAATTAGHAHGSHGHEHPIAPATLDVRPDGEVGAGRTATLHLTIRDGAGSVVKEFTETHDAKVHLIIVREGLDQFAHLHPEVQGGQGELTVRHTFPVGGTYLLFADFRPTGRPAATATGRLHVAGDAPPAPPLQPTAPGRVTGDGVTADVSVEGAKGGGDATIRFALLGPDGKPATDLEPYMGAMGHLNVLSADAKRYVHAHPAHGPAGAANEVVFAAHVPEAGLYKGWGQFKRGGAVRVVPFVLRAE